MSTAEKVRAEFEQLPPGGVIASAELHRLSDNSTKVDKAVSRLFGDSGLKKLRNGIYYRPVESEFFGTLPPVDQEILRSLRRQYEAIILPSGHMAAHQLGLVTDAPEQKIYDSDKRIGPVASDNTRLLFRQVVGKKLHSGDTELVTLLLALEYLFKADIEFNNLQRQVIQRLLDSYPRDSLERAIAKWPRWFREDINPFIRSSEVGQYITGTSAFNIPYQGKLSDWHQMGMLVSDKFQIAGGNYHSAPDLSTDELFDCSGFLNKHGVDLPVALCAKPARAVKDILYTNIFIKHRYPEFLSVDQYVLPLSASELEECVTELRAGADQQQLKLLDQWLTDNGIV